MQPSSLALSDIDLLFTQNFVVLAKQMSPIIIGATGDDYTKLTIPPETINDYFIRNGAQEIFESISASVSNGELSPANKEIDGLNEFLLCALVFRCLTTKKTLISSYILVFSTYILKNLEELQTLPTENNMFTLHAWEHCCLPLLTEADHSESRLDNKKKERLTNQWLRTVLQKAPVLELLSATVFNAIFADALASTTHSLTAGHQLYFHSSPKNAERPENPKNRK